MLGIELGTGILFAVYILAVVSYEAQATSEVRPDDLWRYGRIVSHLLLISLLVAATVTDLIDYVIPDQVTLTGIAIGLGIAVVSGDTQIIHLWVDWNQEREGLQGAYIPEWIKDHRHLHGLAWSLAGIVTGGGLTWLARLISSVILGQEALGFGDVTLMAMIGAFLGWQPTLFVFLLAPFCGMVVGAAVKLLTNRSFIPYGPFLSFSAFVVLCTWRWIWMWESEGNLSVRHLFGDPVGLGILTGIAVGGTVALLGLIRLYRIIPGKQRDGEAE